MFGFVKRWLLRRALDRWLESLEGSGMLNFIKAFFGGSKKATVVLAGVLLVIFRDALGLDAATAGKLIQLIMTYIVGQGVVDASLVFKGLKER